MPASDDPVFFTFGALDVGTSGGRAIQVLEWDVLYDSVPLRGGNEVMPGAEGRRQFELTKDEREVTLFLQFNGRWSDAGTPTVGDWRAAASARLRQFEAALDIGATGQTFIWHDYGVNLDADVQYLGLRGTRFASSSVVNTSLDLILPPTLTVLP